VGNGGLLIVYAGPYFLELSWCVGTMCNALSGVGRMPLECEEQGILQVVRVS
jgi:hypothetical protein